jgi:hypothetical protein
MEVKTILKINGKQAKIPLTFGDHAFTIIGWNHVLNYLCANSNLSFSKDIFFIHVLF